MPNFRSATVAERLKDTGGRTAGFDYMRFSLASAIILWHGISISYGSAVGLEYWRGPIGIGMHFALPMFFALSGFLVAGSLDRCPTLISFFGLRVLRIVPALGVEVTLSALVFGPLLTSHSLTDYIGSSELFRYFLNIAGDIHYRLPGLFENNPLPLKVNAQLWTIPFELQCYLAIGALATAAVLRKRSLLLGIVMLSQAVWAWQAIKLGDTGGSNGASGPVLVIAFLTGIAFHLYRDRIRLHWGIFTAALVAGWWLSSLPHGSYYLALPATYITVYLGLLNPPANRLLASGDYSYGLYLYGFPIQQAVASYGPETHHWWINIGLSFPAALLVAFGSWHLVERPALSARRRLPAIEAALVSWVSSRRVDATRADRMLRITRCKQPKGVEASLATRALIALALAGASVGTLLLVTAHEWAGTVAIAATFATCILGFLSAEASGRHYEGRQAARPAIVTSEA